MDKLKPLCTNCQSPYHYQTFCPYKIKKPINRNKQGKIRPRNDRLQKEREFKNRWIQLNPPDRWGYWYCYLTVSPLCLKRLWIDELTIEHVIPKSRGKEHKYNLENIKPSCAPCNSLKGSRTLESLAKEYPHLNKYLLDTN